MQVTHALRRAGFHNASRRALGPMSTASVTTDPYDAGNHVVGSRAPVDCGARGASREASLLRSRAHVAEQRGRRTGCAVGRSAS
jgi:hypothetical protein